MNKQLDEVESFCLKAIKKDESHTVEIYFGPYLSYGPRTQHTGLIKAYMLLYYFSLDMKKAFYFTLETVTPEELEDENIKLAMKIERCVSTGAVENLKKLIKGNSKKELNQLLKNIFESQRKSIELSGSEGESEGKIGQNDRKNIDIAMFIGKNVANF